MRQGTTPGYEARKEKDFSEKTPEEAKQSVKQRVKKAIAAVAGAIEGFNEAMREDRVPQQTREALKNAGETTREVAHSAKEETRKTRDSFQSEGPKGRGAEPLVRTGEGGGQKTRASPPMTGESTYKSQEPTTGLGREEKPSATGRESAERPFRRTTSR
ncbi:MAG: hypothetical protein KY455_04295 [Euryarchaeota archaeon]|nr:hypothetical protein [Euryarchaeota archaeon]